MTQCPCHIAHGICQFYNYEQYIVISIIYLPMLCFTKLINRELPCDSDMANIYIKYNQSGKVNLKRIYH